MDTWATKAVMGWKQTAPEVFCFEFESGRGVSMWTGRDNNPNPVNPYKSFRPSENLLDSWKLVEMVNQSCFVDIEIGVEGLGVTVRFCRMEVPEGMNVYCAKKMIVGNGWDARSLPLAICRSAIKSTLAMANTP